MSELQRKLSAAQLDPETNKTKAKAQRWSKIVVFMMCIQLGVGVAIAIIQNSGTVFPSNNYYAQLGLYGVAAANAFFSIVGFCGSATYNRTLLRFFLAYQLLYLIALIAGLVLAPEEKGIIAAVIFGVLLLIWFLTDVPAHRLNNALAELETTEFYIDGDE